MTTATDTDPDQLTAALELLAGLIVEDDGTVWGDRATADQWADARAILTTPATDPDAPRLHYLTRPRGGSKTTDVAAVVLVALLVQAPRLSRSHAYARDRDQAALLLDAAARLVAMNDLAGLVDVGADTLAVRATGASLAVESADAASAFGHIPFLVVCDEFAQWPTTRNARALWEALFSGLPKRPGSRLVLMTTAGDPAHPSRPILEAARTSPRWRTSEWSGPVTWADPDDLAEQARILTPSAYARLHLNRWTSAEDRLVGEDDLAAAVVRPPGALPPSSRHRYVIGLDLGLVHDRTVVSVLHAETEPDPALVPPARANPQTAPGRPDTPAPADHPTPTPDGAPGPAGAREARPFSGRSPLYVLDDMHVLEGTPSRPVNLSEVERVVRQLARDYRATVHADKWQAAGMIQAMRRDGLRVVEWNASGAGVTAVALPLHLALRERRLALPDDPDLTTELSRVRLRENGAGHLRMDHDAAEHDDRAMSLGLALALLGDVTPGRGGITVPSRLLRARTMTDARPTLPVAQALRRAERTGPRLPGGALLRPGSGNDPRRVTRSRY